MRVFVTGATGFIGQAVVKELLKNGHQVLGLTRSDKGAETLTAQGAEVHRGTLEDLESLKSGAAASDAVIHLAFDHNFTDYVNSCVKDRTAIEALGSALVGTNRPLITTSGSLLLPNGKLSTEDDTFNPEEMAAARGAAETLTLSFVEKGVRACVVRLAPTNHGEGDEGFIPMLIAKAKELGVSSYVGDGMNRWPALHRLDTARLYVLALEKGKAGSVYHATDEEGVTLKEIAELIGERLNVPAVSKTFEEVQAQFGFMSFPLSRDNPVSSKKTREQLGWTPVQPKLLEDIKAGFYFEKIGTKFAF